MNNNTLRYLLAALLGGLVLLSVACSPPAQEGGEESATDAILLQVPDDPTVSFAVWFQVGSQNDPPGKEGLALLTGQMISDGATTANSYEAILEKLYPLASSYSVRVDKEMTTVTGRTHRDNLDAFFALYTDAYLRPAFNEADFERLKSNQLNALQTSLRFSSDEDLGKAALALAVFGGTPYAHPALGTVQGLEAITLDDVRAFYAEHYVQARAKVALGGGFDDALVQRFDATLKELPKGIAAAAPSVEPSPIEGRSVLLVAKDDADASISFGYPIDVRRGDREFYALWVANSWLGEHRNSSSHLYQVIREARGMNYGDYSYIEEFPQGGQRQMPPTNVARRHQLFQVWIRTLPNEQAHFALRAAIREVDLLIENGMSEEEFELTKSFLSKYHLHFAETTQARLGYRIDDVFYGLDQPHLERFGEVLKTLTLDEVNAAIKKHLQTANLEIAIVTGQAETLKEALASDAASPMSYASEKPEEVLEEDKTIASYPLGIAADAVEILPVEEIFEK